MKIETNNKTAGRLAIILTLIYAFTTRSILAGFLYRTQIQLLLFYAITYLLLGLCFLRSFDRTEGHLYAKRGFYSILCVTAVIIYELFAAGNTYSLLYYGMALLLPFAIDDEIIMTTWLPKFFVAISAFFSIGCFVNFVLPSAYKAVILPMFSANAQQSLLEVEKLSGSGTYFAGFTSQVGYTSFFISMGIGAVFCFKGTVIKRISYPLIIIMFAALLLTGKRGPLMFLLIALAAIYFMDGYGRERILRVAKIALMLCLAYGILTVIARATQIDGILRIYDAVNEVLTSGSVEDAGRSQLYEQALMYFRQHPLFGIGWANFKSLYSFRGTHVHCIYFQLLCETGLVGTAIFVIFFVSRLVASARSIKTTMNEVPIIENGWMKFSFFIQLYFLLYGITGNPLYDIEETILYFFAVGVSLIQLSGWSTGLENEK